MNYFHFASLFLIEMLAFFSHIHYNVRMLAHYTRVHEGKLRTI
jgi:hypothetical protein